MAECGRIPSSQQEIQRRAWDRTQLHLWIFGSYSSSSTNDLAPLFDFLIPTGYHVGLTLHKEGFVFFHNFLKDYIANGNWVEYSEIKWVLVRSFSSTIASFEGSLHDSLLKFKDMISNACQRHTILTQKTYESLKSTYDAGKNEAEANDQGNGRALEFLEEVHANWDQTSE